MLLFKKCIVVIIIFFHGFAFTAEKHHVTVGYQPETDLIRDISNIGKEGIGYEIIKKIEHETDLAFEFKPYSDDLLTHLRNKDVDVIGLSFKTPEIENEFLFLENPFNTVIAGLATYGDKKNYYDDPQSINGKTVSTYRANPYNDTLNKYLKENDIFVNYLYGEVETYLDLEADYYLTFSSGERSQDYYTVLNLGTHSTYLVFNKTDEELMHKINDAYERISFEEGFFVNELIAKYNEESIQLSHRELTRSEINELKEKTLRVGYVENHRPFSYTDEEGKANGAVIDIMESFSNRYGFEVDYYPYTLTENPKEHIDFDILVSTIGTSTEEALHYEPTESYHSIPMVFLSKRTHTEENVHLDDVMHTAQRIGTLRYLYTNFDLFFNTNPNRQVVFYDTFIELLDAYENGDVELAAFTSLGSTYADAYLEENAHFLFGADFTIDLRFSVLNELSEDFIPIFNVMFDNITKRSYDQIFTIHATSYYLRENILTLMSEQWVYFAAVAMLVFLIFMVFIYKLQEQKKDMVIQAYQTDRLTGGLSISYYYEKAQEILTNLGTKKYELISFDIDYFRTINSYYSIDVGTKIIIAVSKALDKAFKNTPVLYARKTAEQFLILRSIDQGGKIEDIYSKHILPSVKDIAGEYFKISFSFGSVFIDNAEENISVVVAHADYARLAGKSSHETAFVVFDNKMKKKFTAKLHITFKMDRAIQDKEFKVFYQPKIDFQTLSIVGAEALVRWTPVNGDIIYPDDFIEVFERNGFISKLDTYVFEEVCKFISSNRKNMIMPTISVNLSAVTVLEKSIVEQLLLILKKYSVEPKEIELEITETAIISGEENFLEKIRQLKKSGFYVSIDDFGSGVSSLNRLCCIEADVLKLDKAFFEQSEYNEKTSIVVDQVITLAKKLNMKIVAEGVETYQQAVWLRGLNCDIAQGFYFSTAIDESAFIEHLRKEKKFKMHEKSK